MWKETMSQYYLLVVPNLGQRQNSKMQDMEKEEGVKNSRRTP